MRLRVLRVAAVIVVVAALAQLVATTLPYVPGLVIPGLGVAVAGFLSALRFARHARAASGRYRAGWWLTTIGSCAMGVSYVLYCVTAIRGGKLTDSPGELFSIFAATVSAVSVLILAPRVRSKAAWLTHLLDFAAVAAGQFAVIWHFVLAPATATLSPHDKLSTVLVLVPEVAGAALALMLVSRTSPGRRGYALHLLAGSLGMFATASIITTHNAATNADWHSFGAAFATVSAAALAVLASRATLAPADERGWRSLRGFWAAMPCLPIFAAITAAVSEYLGTGALSPVMVWTLLATTVLTTLRQLLGFVTVARLANALNHLAHHDPLTGLANRAAFATRAEEALADAAPDNQVAVLLLDLDGFKPVNDTHGHAVGDRLLVAVAERLTAACRDTDLAARIGGDEFVLIATNLASHAAADQLAQRVVAAVAVPVHDGELTIDVRTSVGIAVADAPGPLDAVLKRADDSLYAAKAAGRGQVGRRCDQPVSR